MDNNEYNSRPDIPQNGQGVPPQAGFQSPYTSCPPYRPYAPDQPAYEAMQRYDGQAVPPPERAAIKRSYFGTFGRAMFHAIGSTIFALIMYSIMELSGYDFRYTDDGTAIIDWIYCIAGAAPSIIMCFSIFLFDKAVSRNRLGSYFNNERITAKFTIGFFGVLMLAYAAAVILQNITVSAFFSIDISPISENYLTESDFSTKYFIAEVLCGVILAPIAEELMFRGVILRRLSNISGTFAIFVSAAIFGMMHGNLLQTILGFIIGIVFGYAAVKTGSLLLPIAGHMFINACATSSEFVEYFIDEEASQLCWGIMIVMFALIGLIALVAVLASGKLKFPEYTDYHKKRTFPIVLSCVSFWILLIVYLIDIISAFGPVTDKLRG